MSAEDLERRGSWRAKGRKEKEERAAALANTKFTDYVRDTELPIGMSEKAGIFWRWHAAHLAAAGILTAETVDTFYILCETWRHYEDAEDGISEDGDLIIDGAPNPYIEIRDLAVDRFLEFAAKFGLFPKRPGI